MAKKATSGGGKLHKDEGRHPVPGFMSGGGKPKEWEARKGYTSERKTGPSAHGTKINLPKG